jgi:hypothetical protein
MPTVLDSWFLRLLVFLGVLPKSVMEYEAKKPLPFETSMPASFFADEEIIGSRVRLMHTVPVGGTYFLQKGECFVVSGTLPPDAKYRRKLLLNNHRAESVPVRDCVCELLFQWPSKVEGNRDGKNSRQ